LGAERLPVVYLDCDRPGLLPEEPITLLIEAVRQLGLQFPQMRPTAERLSQTWLGRLAAAHAAQTDVSYTRDLGQVMKDMQVFLEDLNVRKRPVLFIIDTFEEVQYRSQSYAKEVFQFLQSLQSPMPYLRTVVAGRNPLSADEFPHEPLPLEALDFEA